MVNAEQALVGSILSAPGKLTEVVDLVKAADFSTQAGMSAYAIMVSLWRQKQPVDLVTVAGRLPELTAYLAASTSMGFGPSAAAYAKQVATEGRVRRIKAAASSMASGSDPDAMLASLLALYQTEMAAGAKDPNIQAVVRRVEQHIAENKKRGSLGFQTGFQTLREMYITYQPGHIWTVGGWCLGKGTGVIMANGEVSKVEDIKQGDELAPVFSDIPRKVVGTTTGTDTLYRISGKYIEPFVVNSQHLFPVLFVSGSYGHKDTRIKHMTAEQLYSQGSAGGAKKNYRLLRTPYEVTEDPLLPVEPYVLGYWLGDGTTGKPEITIDSKEVELIEYFREYSGRVGLNFTCRADKRKEHVLTVGFKTKRGGDPSTRKHALIYSLPKTKVIPEIYFRARLSSRLELLAGLTDSDGCIGGVGKTNLVFSQKDIGLTKQVKRLAESCGLNVSLKTVIQRGSRLIKSSGEELHKLTISGHTYKIPNKIKRRMVASRPRISQNSDEYIPLTFDVECIGRGEYYGFELDGNKLFLTENNVVNHNTSTGKTATMVQQIVNLLLIGEDPSILVISTEMTEEQVVARLVANITGVASGRILSDRFNDDEEAERVAAAKDAIKASKLLIYDDIYTLSDIETAFRKAELQGGVDVGWIDYVQNCRVTDAKSQYQEQSELAKRLQSLAKDVRATIICLSQVSNDVGRGNTDNLELKGAGEWGAVSDVGVMLTRNKLKKYLMKYEIKKNRHGRLGEMGLEYKAEWTSLKEVPLNG